MSDHETQRFIKSIPLLRAELTIAADSCSLIFLNRLNILEAYAGIHEIVLTQAIYDEITRIPDNTKTTDDRALYQKLFDARVLSVHAIAAPPVHQCSALSPADLSLLHAYETLKPNGILTDDKNLCRYCREHTIPYINTPMAIFVLLYNGHLSHNQYSDTLLALYEIGRYGQFVRDYMQKIYTRYCAYTNHTQ